MPELPEVETVKLGLQDKIIGKKIIDLEILSAKSFQGEKEKVIGATVKSINRRAKILIIELDNGFSLVAHLKMTGQLVYFQGNRQATFGHPIPFAGTTLPAKTTRLIFTFNDKSKLYFNDVRKFGWIKAINNEKLKIDNLLGEFGPEPFTAEFALENFKEILKKSKKPIKLLLMDQKIIAGVGNIYANEALFDAGVTPLKKSNELSEKETEKLYDSLLKVLKEGIKYGGSSDKAFVNVSGEFGKMQEHFKVYGRKGKPCPNKCSGEIKRIAQGGRGTFYCPACQK